MGLQLITPASAELVSLIEAKQHLRVDDDEQNATIRSLVRAAVEMAEHLTERQFVTATWRLTLDRFPACNGPIRLPRPPLQSVSSITYIDPDGVEQTMPTDDYRIDCGCEPGLVRPAYDVVWPSTRTDANVVTIQFVAGYGNPAACPERAKHLAKLLLGHWYENREAVLTGAMSRPIEYAVSSLVRQLAVKEFV